MLTEANIRAVKKKLKDEPFDPDEFVRNLSNDNSHDILEYHRQIVQSIAEETARELKSNVYKNYQQFINTSQDVSHLESEMFQISHLLHDQEQLFSYSNQNEMLRMESQYILDGGAADDQPEQKEEPRSLAYLLEIVEGCSQLTDVSGRYVVYSGILRELDPDAGTEIQKFKAFLLNDALLIATNLRRRQKRGPVQYKFQSLIELDGMAVVRIKEGTTPNSTSLTDPIMKNAFKILKFPDSHLYSTDSLEETKHWINILEETKQKYKASRAKLKKYSGSVDSSKLSFDDTINITNSATGSKKKSLKHKQIELLQQDWLKELPEQLDVYIAQRDFEKAVDQVERAKSYLKDFTDSFALRDMRSRIDLRIKQLCEALKQELCVSRGASLRGGPRASRKAVALLLRLERNSQACELFLKNRTRLIRHDLTQQKSEVATPVYIEKLSKVFFEAILDTALEFQQAFGNEKAELKVDSNNRYDSYSTFVVWCRQELVNFSKIFSNHTFNTPNLEMAIECIEIAQSAACVLHDIGLDFRHIFLTHIEKSILSQLEDSTKFIIETIPRASLDYNAWRPYDLRKDQKMLSKTSAKMIEFGIEDFGNLVFDDGIIDLASATVRFIELLNDLCFQSLKIDLPELHRLLQKCLFDMVNEHCASIVEVFEKTTDVNIRQFLLKNLDFLWGTVLPCLENSIEDVIGKPPIRLNELAKSVEDTCWKLKDKYHLIVTKTPSNLSSVKSSDDDV